MQNAHRGYFWLLSLYSTDDIEWGGQVYFCFSRKRHVSYSEIQPQQQLIYIHFLKKSVSPEADSMCDVP